MRAPRKKRSPSRRPQKKRTQWLPKNSPYVPIADPSPSLSEADKRTTRAKVKEWLSALPTAAHRCEECGAPVPYSTATRMPCGIPLYLCWDCEEKMWLTERGRSEARRQRTREVFAYAREYARRLRTRGEA